MVHFECVLFGLDPAYVDGGDGVGQRFVTKQYVRDVIFGGYVAKLFVLVVFLVDLEEVLLFRADYPTH